MKYILLSVLLTVSIYSNEIIYTDPVNGSGMILPENNITIGFNKPINYSATGLLQSIRVTGTSSGIHYGKILITENSKKIIFKPDRPFSEGEIVFAEFSGVLNEYNIPGSKIFKYSFCITGKKIYIDPVKTMEKETGLNLHNPQMLIAPPVLNITVNNSPAPGKLFLAPLAGYSYNTILNNNGSFYWFQQYSAVTYDFKKQPNGNLTYYSGNPPRFIELDAYYNIVHTYQCGNGYTTDMHDLQLLPNGNAYIMAYDPQHVDMSQIVSGGNPNATVIGLIIQEIDQQNNVLFQWRSWDHMLITDAVRENLLDSVIDYVHGNAIEVDFDNNILLSSRHLDEITKINRSTGNIIWRFGGKNNMYNIYNDSLRFSHQHDIRRISNGNVTLYDNGSFRPPEYARALEYSLDENNLNATLVWQFQRNPQVIATWGGNVQRLPNGNTLIAWGGSLNTITEVKPDGTVVFDASYSPGVNTYRGFKFIYPADPNGIEHGNNSPFTFNLNQNYPNPFNPATMVKFSLDKAAVTSLIIYDIKGSEIMNSFTGFLNPGSHVIKIDGSNLSSGIYIYKLISGEKSASRKMILIK